MNYIVASDVSMSICTERARLNSQTTMQFDRNSVLVCRNMINVLRAYGNFFHVAPGAFWNLSIPGLVGQDA